MKCLALLSIRVHTHPTASIERDLPLVRASAFRIGPCLPWQRLGECVFGEGSPPGGLRSVHRGRGHHRLTESHGPRLLWACAGGVLPGKSSGCHPPCPQGHGQGRGSQRAQGPFCSRVGSRHSGGGGATCVSRGLRPLQVEEWHVRLGPHVLRRRLRRLRQLARRAPGRGLLRQQTLNQRRQLRHHSPVELMRWQPPWKGLFKCSFSASGCVPGGGYTPVTSRYAVTPSA